MSNSDREASEKGPDYYDCSFRDNDVWREHYTKSRYYPLWTVIADRIVRSGAQSVLDIGCGPGQLAALLRDKRLSCYFGLDFSSERIQYARQTCPEFTFVVQDIFRTELLQSQNYDTVVCTEFLEHVNRDCEVIEMIKRGTRFLGTVPNFPYVSHVRHFKNCDDVSDRYATYFDRYSVDAHLANDSGTTYFLIDGIKR